MDFIPGALGRFLLMFNGAVILFSARRFVYLYTIPPYRSKSAMCNVYAQP